MKQAPVVCSVSEGDYGATSVNNSSLALQVESRCANQSCVLQRLCDEDSVRQCLVNLREPEISDFLRYQPLTEITVGRQCTCGNSSDCCVPRQIHRICDDRR